MEYRRFEGTFIVREAGPVAIGALVTSMVGLGVFLAFGHHAEQGPVRPASAVTSTVPTPTTMPASAPGCVMLCDEPPLPAPDSRGCHLFCDLGMPRELGGRS